MKDKLKYFTRFLAIQLFRRRFHTILEWEKRKKLEINKIFDILIFGYFICAVMSMVI